MKFSLHFDSVSEFVQFIISVSSIRIEYPYKKLHSPPYRYTSANDIWFALRSVVVREDEETESRYYKVREIADTQPPDIFEISNFMCNETQIGNEYIFVAFDGQVVQGIRNVTELLEQKFPRQFLLKVGWRTDHITLQFKAKTFFERHFS